LKLRSRNSREGIPGTPSRSIVFVMQRREAFPIEADISAQVLLRPVRLLQSRFIPVALALLLGLPVASSPAPAKKAADPGARRVPGGAKTERYAVQAGDTLYALARARGTSVRAVMAANGLRRSALSIGQILRLPPEARIAPEQASTQTRPSDLFETDPAESQELEFLSEGDSLRYLPENKSPTLRERLVDTARQLLGTRYRRSGTSEMLGFDCSGLVQNVYRRFGIDLPRSSREQIKLGDEVTRDRLEKGDLVFFSSARRKTPNHVAIYVGENQILHALSGARKVVATPTDSSWFRRRFLGARRIPGLWQDEVVVADAGARQ
jgi:cell wall-associated NlpC family hydrolase